MTSRGMEDKENVHGNMWHSHQQDNNNSEAKHEKKRVAFQCEEGEERAAAPRPLASCRGSDDDFNNNNHSTNVTPSNQTSEILQEKMRELREKLEKLKSKGRKSGTDGIDGGGGTAPSSPMLEQESSSSEAPDRNPKEPKQLSKQQISPCAVSSTEPSRSSSPLTPATPSTPLLNTPPGPSSSSATATSSAVSAPSTKSSKPRLKLPTPLGTSSSVTARKKPRLPGPGSLLSKPAQRVSVDEARAQSEEPAVVEEAMPSPSPLPSADVFRAPVSKRDAIKSAEPKLEMARPEARMEVIEVDNVAAKKESTSSSEAALDKVAQRREARRSREMKAAAAAARQAEREKDGMRKQEQTAEAYPSLEIVNITADTASSRPLNNTAVTTTATMSTESGYRSTASSQTIDTAPETPKHSEAREAGERTREQDRPNKPMDTSTDQGQDPQAQEKALFALACQRGALEFLHGFAAGGTSFLTVNGRRYMKLDQIGRGGSSKVYRVVSPNWSTYALKYVPLKNTDTVTEESYLNEISLLKKLSHHDNIIRLVDSEVRPGGIFLLLEFAELDLDRMLRAQQQRNRAIAAEVRLFWQQMLEAVHTIHEERVVHGDLKPANFVCIQGRLKLIDFGIAKAISNDTTNIVRDNQIGTLNYISPEALIDTSSGQNTKFKLGRPSDIWSLGCILYQMVYGRSPFAMLDNMIRKLQAISNPKYKIDYPPIDNPPLMETMRLCLQFDPRRRPSIPELLKHPFLQ